MMTCDKCGVYAPNVEPVRLDLRYHVRCPDCIDQWYAEKDHEHRVAAPDVRPVLEPDA